MEDYLRAYHRDEILAVLESPKKAQNYEILLNLTHLKENSSFFTQFSKDYNSIFKNINRWIKAVKNVQQEIKDELNNELNVKQNISIKLTNHPGIDENFKLYADKQFLKLVAFKATIVKRHHAKTRIITKQFMCSKCKHPEIIYGNRFFNYAFVHGRCENTISFKTSEKEEDLSEKCGGKMVPVKYTPKKSQKTLVTQAYEVTTPHLEQHNSYGDKTYFVNVEGKLINSFEIGQTVDIIGIVKTRNSSRKPKMKKFGISALNIEAHQKVDLSKDLTTNTDFRALSAWHYDISNSGSELAVRNRIVEDLFPKIVGAQAIKLAILLVICSGSGKNQSEANDKSEKRDVFHLMLAGRNSAGKRTLLRAAAELAPKATEVHSYGLTLSSLTARAFKIKKGGNSNIEAGVLLRANDGITCFQDFNGLKKKYRRVLHEIMETQRVKVASARLKANIKVSASIIAAHRLKRDRLKKKVQNEDQVITSKTFKVEETLLNRFDLIFIMNEPKNDADYTNQLMDMVLEEAMGIEKEVETEWPRSRITAHLALAKTYGSVEFTQEVEAILQKYFLFCTLHPNIPKWRASNRMFDGLKRITAAHTRLMLRKKTKIFDAITTILLTELSYPFGYLMDTKCELNDNLPGPDNECAKKILWLLKLSEYYDVFVEEQSNMEDVENQLLTWMYREAEAKEQPENYIQEKSMYDENLSFSVSSISMIEDETQKSTLTPQPSVKKQNVTKKTPQRSKKGKSNEKSIPNVFKRKVTPTNSSSNETISPKKSRIEEPLINDAIVANLSSLSKMFAPPPEIVASNTSSGKENILDEEEMRAMEMELQMFDDL